MDSDTPNLAALQILAREFEATLLVDVAHDLGSIGEGGRGFIGSQNVLGKIDIVMGSFSKTFASNGGFVSCNSLAVKEVFEVLRLLGDVFQYPVSGAIGYRR